MSFPGDGRFVDKEPQVTEPHTIPNVLTSVLRIDLLPQGGLGFVPLRIRTQTVLPRAGPLPPQQSPRGPAVQHFGFGQRGLPIESVTPVCDAVQR